MRKAIIEHKVGSTTTLAMVQRYLPSNYTVRETHLGDFIIDGEDLHGWTLEGYVIPRLASGGIVAIAVL